MWFIEFVKVVGATNATALLGGVMGVIIFGILKGVVITKGDTKIELGGKKQ